MSIGEQSAFPVNKALTEVISNTDPKNLYGMTLRQYYVGQALIGLCSMPISEHLEKVMRNLGATIEEIEITRWDILTNQAIHISDLLIQKLSEK